MRAHALLLFALALIGCENVHQESPQSEDSFLAAVRNQSTAPSYVKIQVKRPTSDAETNCVTANLLLGAIHIEHGLPYTDSGVAAAEGIAISAPNHSFQFSKQEALANLPDLPNSSELAAATRLVGNQAVEDLEESLRDGSLRDFYSGSDRRNQKMAALACGLIDRGLRPWRADITGTVQIGN